MYNKDPIRPYYVKPKIVQAVKRIMCNGKFVVMRPVVTKPIKSSASKQVIDQ